MAFSECSASPKSETRATNPSGENRPPAWTRRMGDWQPLPDSGVSGRFLASSQVTEIPISEQRVRRLRLLGRLGPVLGIRKFGRQCLPNCPPCPPWKNSAASSKPTANASKASCLRPPPANAHHANPKAEPPPCIPSSRSSPITRTLSWRLMPNRSSLRLWSVRAPNHTPHCGMIQAAWNTRSLAMIWEFAKRFVCFWKAERTHSEPVRTGIR